MKNTKELSPELQELVKVAVYLLGINIISSHGGKPDKSDLDFIEIVAHDERILLWLKEDGIKTAKNARRY